MAGGHSPAAHQLRLRSQIPGDAEVRLTATSAKRDPEEHQFSPSHPSLCHGMETSPPLWRCNKIYPWELGRVWLLCTLCQGSLGSAALAHPAAMNKSFAVAMPGPSFQCDPKQKERKTLEMSEWRKLCAGAQPPAIVSWSRMTPRVLIFIIYFHFSNYWSYSIFFHCKPVTAPSELPRAIIYMQTLSLYFLKL